MSNKTRSSAGLAVVFLTLLVQACATHTQTETTPEYSSSTQQVEHIEHTIKPGDRLGDISLKYTGDILRWETIAAFNNITDPRTLRIGDVLKIPVSLIPAERLTQVTPTGYQPDKVNDNNRALANQRAIEADVTTTTSGALAVQRSMNTGPAQADVVIRPVTINRSFELNPIDQPAINAARATNENAPQVRVVGTYYPKGVYQQAASYSRLMMRVAPGTLFELEREVNDWYKVITPEGIGYLRALDGEIVTPDQARPNR